MKLFYITLFIITMLPGKSHGQYSLQPGKGIGAVRLGMHVSGVNALVGRPKSSATYKEELGKWKKEGYTPEKELVFQLPFDKVYTYPDSNALGLYKVYTLHDTVVVLSISSFGSTAAVFSHITLPNQLHFFSDSAQLVQCMGNNFTQVNSRYKSADYTQQQDNPNNEMEYLYPQQGVSFLIIDGKLTNVFLFKPNNNICPQQNEHLVVMQ